MHNERKVFGRICPNRIANCHSRIEDKKPATYCEKQEAAKNAKNNVPVSIYIEENISIVDEAFATIAWQDLGDCTSVLRRESDSSDLQDSVGFNKRLKVIMAVETCRYTQFPHWGYDFQMHGSGFAIQDFVDSGVSFIPDSPSLLDTSACSSGSLPLSDCSLSDFPGCTILPIPSVLDMPPQQSLSHTPPVAHQALPQDTPQEQLFWRNLAEHQQRALGDVLDTNNQLHLTLNKKQEETRSLQQRNLHLKELANQAKHLASVLSRLISPTGNPPPPGGPPALHSPTKRRRLEWRSELEGDGMPAGEDVSRILRDVSDRCRAVLQEQAGDRPHSARMHGKFQGLLTSTPHISARPQVGEEEEDEGTAFRTFIRDHCTIRTLTFPQGHAFISRTPQGGCRFRWIPS